MKYNSTNKPIQCFMRQSTCYQQTNKNMTVKGVLWHSTGANNPWIKRYVQPDDNASDRTQMLALLGKNAYNNDWNHIYHEAGLNCWIGKLADGTVTTVQTMPWNYKPWGCGSGSKGSCNTNFIQFEICEDGLTDKTYFDAVYKEACEITAYLCQLYNIDPKGTVNVNGVTVPTILCHHDSYKLGLGSNHGDIDHWFPKHGKSMATARDDVAALLKGAGVTPSTPAQPATPATTSTFKAGDLVKITGTKYYSGADIPAWVKAKNWYVKEASGARVVIDKSEDGKNAICSPVNAKDLALANATTPATPATPAPSANTKKVVAKGIDVSKWQGEIDWAKVKAAGIDFAMIRLGYGSADGTECGVDNYFEKNVAGAVKAGVDIGCYFYTYGTSVAAVKKEAEFVIGVLNKYKGVFTYPVAFDLEDNSQAGLGKETLTNMVIAFGDAIEKAGFYASLYSNLNWLKNYLDDSKLTRFDHWLAQWAAAPTYTGEFGMWQSSSTGSVNGISGNVDTDVAYKDYPAQIKSKKLNGFTSATQVPVAPAAPVVEPAKPADTGLKFKVNDIVNFTGKTHYTSASAATGSAVKASKAKITAVYATGKHPYHCRAVNDSGAFVGGVYGWVDAADVSAIEAAKPATPAPAPVTPAKPAAATIKVGDVVKITGTKYYSGAKIPDWVRAKNWIVKEVSGARVVIDKSQDGKNAICSPVNAADLAVVTASAAPAAKPATSVVNATIEAGDTVKIVGTKYYSGAKIPDWVKAKNWIVLEAKGDRVVVDKSADGKNAICSPIKRSDLQLVKKK